MTPRTHATHPGDPAHRLPIFHLLTLASLVAAALIAVAGASAQDRSNEPDGDRGEEEGAGLTPTQIEVRDACRATPLGGWFFDCGCIAQGADTLVAAAKAEQYEVLIRRAESRCVEGGTLLDPMRPGARIRVDACQLLLELSGMVPADLPLPPANAIWSRLAPPDLCRDAEGIRQHAVNACAPPKEASESQQEAYCDCFIKEVTREWLAHPDRYSRIEDQKVQGRAAAHCRGDTTPSR